MDPPDIISIQQQQLDMHEVRDKLAKFLLKPVSNSQTNSNSVAFSELTRKNTTSNNVKDKHEKSELTRSRSAQILLKSLDQLQKYKEGDNQKENNEIQNAISANEIYDTSSLCTKVLWKICLSSHKLDQSMQFDIALKHLTLIELLYDCHLYQNALEELKFVFSVFDNVIKGTTLSVSSLGTSKVNLKHILKGIKFKQISQNSTLLEIISRINNISIELVTSVLLSHFELKGSETITHQELMQFTSKDSNFYFWLHSLPPHSRTELASRTSQRFNILSECNRTILKLVYLFKSLEFGIMAHIQNDILNRCIPIFSLMVKKNEQMVYQYTASLFFHICGLWTEYKLPISRLNTLLRVYNAISSTILSKASSKKLDWSQYFSNQGNQDSLLDLLKHVNDSASNSTKLIELFDESAEWQLFSDPEFCSTIKDVVNNDTSYEIDEPNKRQLLISILNFLRSASNQTITQKTTTERNFYKFQLEILDLYMIKLKSFNVIKDPEFIQSCTMSLFQILKGSIHFPRLRNISNYLFHASSVLIGSDYDYSLKFCMYCINIEYNILASEPLKHEENLKVFKLKSGRIANMLINIGKYDDAMMFISKVFDLYKIDTENGHLLNQQSSLYDDLSTLIKLCAKITIDTKSIAPVKWYGSSDFARVLILLEIVTLLGNTAFPERNQVYTRIILKLKNELNDNGLFLYFLSQLSFISDMAVSLKSLNELEFPETSSLFEYRDLIISHIYLLQCCVGVPSTGNDPPSSTFDHDLLQRSYEAMFYWSKKPNMQSSVSDYEMNVFMMHIEYFTNSNLNAYSLVLLDSYQSDRLKILSEDQNYILDIKRCQVQLKLKHHIDISKNKIQSSNNVSQFFGLETTRLIDIECEINKHNLAIAESKLNCLVDECETDDSLNLNKVSSKLDAVKLLVLFQNMCYLSSELFAAKGEYLNCITELKKAIRVLQVIVSTFLSSSLQQKQQKVGLSFSLRLSLTTYVAYGLLKMHCKIADSLKQIGHSKEYLYYQAELTKLISVQRSPYLTSEALFLLTESSLICEQIDKASIYLAQGVEMHNELIFVNKFLDLKNLSANEFYYQILGDTDMLNKYSESYDATANSLLSDETAINDPENFHQLAEKHYHLTDEKSILWSLSSLLQVRARRISSIVNGKVTDKVFDLSMYENGQGSSFDAFIEAKKLLHSGRKLLLNDPVFLNLQDSAIFMNSLDANNGNNAYIDRQLPDNIKTALVNFANCGKDTADFDSSLPRFMKRELNRVILSSRYFMSAIDTANAIECTSEFFLDTEDRMRSEPLIIDRSFARQKENTQTFLALKHNLKVNIDENSVTSKSTSSEAQLVYNKLEKLMPSNWAIVSIDICPVTGDLLLSRYTTKQKDNTILLRLPLNRHNSRDVDQRLFCFQDAIREMNEIIESSNKTTSIERTSKVKSKQEKADWWSERKTIDKRLENLLNDIQLYWFGGFSGIFSDCIYSDLEISDFKAKVLFILSKYLPSRQPGNKRKLPVSDIQLTDSIFEMLLSLGDSGNQLDALEDFIYFVLDVLQYHGETNAYDEIDFHPMISDLSELLKTVNKSPTENKVEHFILMVSGHCVTLPWESIPSLRNKSVSRVPSLQLLAAVLERRNNMNKEIDTSSGYYIINPSGDLLRTECNFKDKFSEMQNWSGVVRDKPTEQNIVTGLTEKNLYVYIGHGGGEHYIKSKTIKNIDNCAPALLLGCSSGSLKVNGVFDPYGTVYDYLLAGSPMVLCNLWDVTDKDIDKFTISMFQKWGLFVDFDSFELDFDDNDDKKGESRTLASVAMSESRDVCVLKYLNGAAPVLYGVPFYIK